MYIEQINTVNTNYKSQIILQKMDQTDITSTINITESMNSVKH